GLGTETLKGFRLLCFNDGGRQISLPASVCSGAAVKSRCRPPFVLRRPSKFVTGLRMFCGGRQISLPASVCSAAAVKVRYRPPFVLRWPSKLVTGLRLFYDGRQSSLPVWFSDKF